ncbi:AAA family ATPase [Paenibacillus sp. WLX1005]|uniref:AAA family ATPase n=1 Tax=Paenibacillus sp. WLX1005 TaxID=3243766 RepID=UPI0039840EFA
MNWELKKRVVNTLLQNIDLLSDEVFVIAATNHQDLLDKAVWRRFKTSIYFKLPDFHMRSQYIEKELAKYSYINKIDIHKIANLTKDFNFSQLHDVLIKAIKTAVFHEKKQIITTNHFMKIIKQYTFLFNDANLESTTLNELKNKGYTLREINELTGIPKSTISDRF